MNVHAICAPYKKWSNLICAASHKSNINHPAQRSFHQPFRTTLRHFSTLFAPVDYDGALWAAMKLSAGGLWKIHPPGFPGKTSPGLCRRRVEFSRKRRGRGSLSGKPVWSMQVRVIDLSWENCGSRRFVYTEYSMFESWSFYENE